MGTKLRSGAGYSKKTKAGKRRRAILSELVQGSKGPRGLKPTYPREQFRGKEGRAKYKSMAGNVKKVFG